MDTVRSPLDALDELLRPAGLGVHDTGGTVRFTGSDPLFPSAVPLATAFSVSAMAAAVGAAGIWRERTGEPQDLSIDLATAAHGINPELTFHPTLNSHPYPNTLGSAHPFSIFPFATRDGRWVYPSAVYPRQQEAWLDFFDCGPGHQRVAKAIATWDAQELEDTASALGHTICIARTTNEWLAHPQGHYLAHEPVIAVQKIGESTPEPFGPARRPLSDVRVLSATHAVAGPVVGRTLAEQGADVLQFGRPNDFEHEWVYDDANVGHRSASLDLTDPQHRDVAQELVRGADIFVDSFRGRKLANLGLSPEELAELRPGIIVVSVRCYGWDGPWGERGGFDMLGTAASGLAMLEGRDGVPSVPPTALINDYVTGYMGAAGASAALLRRAREGGSYHVTVSLTRCAMWYQSLGIVPVEDRSFAFNPFQRVRNLQADDLDALRHVGDRLKAADAIIAETPLGTLRRLAPAVSYSATPAHWRDPLLVPRGSSAPSWAY